MRSCLLGPHISTGDMLRQHVQADDAIGRESGGLLRSGKLVPDDIVNELVEERLQKPDSRAGIILDGYPRTVNQAGVLLGYMERFGFRAGVIHLVVDYEKIVARLSGRRQCPVCGTLYSLKTNPPKAAGICDLDGAALVTREDDSEAVIRARLEEYESRTRPLLDYFGKAGVPVFAIGAESSPEQIAQEVCSRLTESGLLARPVTKGVSVPNASVTS